MILGAPTFLYDFNSPYAYLAAERVEDVLPVAPRWQPIALGPMLLALQRVPWSLRSDEERELGMRECEERARRRGLPALRWPAGWPRESYSLLPLRAALVAHEHGRLREFTRRAYRRLFGDGVALNELDAVLEVAGEAGVDSVAVREGVQRPEVKQRLRDATTEALAAGAVGVPTVVVGGEVFWGDDRLEAAAQALGGVSGPPGTRAPGAPPSRPRRPPTPRA